MAEADAQKIAHYSLTKVDYSTRMRFEYPKLFLYRISLSIYERKPYAAATSMQSDTLSK